MYWCTAGDFKTAFKVTIKEPEKPIVVIEKTPNQASEHRLREEILLKARKKEIESKKRWIRSPAAWNTWILNPVLLTSQ